MKTKRVTDPQAEQTRERILEAAAQVFADRGLEHATIREIVDRAGANIAAVNYHFGGKNELYSAVLTRLMEERHQSHPFTAGLGEDPTPKERLHAFVRAMLRRMLLDEIGSNLGRMMTREMIEPSHALDGLVQNVMRPTAAHLQAIVEAIVGRPLDERERFHALVSVISQVVFHKHCRAVVERMFPEQAMSEAQIGGLARHITEFSYAGFESMRVSPSGAPRRHGGAEAS